MTTYHHCWTGSQDRENQTTGMGHLRWDPPPTAASSASKRVPLIPVPTDSAARKNEQDYPNPVRSVPERTVGAYGYLPVCRGGVTDSPPVGQHP